MNKLVFKRSRESFLGGISLDYGYLFKGGNRIVLENKDYEEIVSISEARYGFRFILSPDQLSFLFLPSCFASSISLYLLPSLSLKACFMEKDYVYKDAVYSNDGKDLYILADKGSAGSIETVLIRYDREEEKTETYFKGGKRRFDSLSFSPNYCCLVLKQNRGYLSYFQDGKIIRETKTSPFRKIYPMDKGRNLISDTDQGFIISAANGKVIRNCDFLLPKDIPEPNSLQKKKWNQDRSLSKRKYPFLKNTRNSEAFADRLVVYESNQVFYITKSYPQGEYYLYFFSLNSFLLKQRIKLKGQYLSMCYSSSVLIVSTTKGIVLYQLKEK